MRLQGTMSVKGNELYIGGVGCKELREKYKTPLYVLDEELVRSNCKEYIKHFKVHENKNRVAYAGKAFLPIYMCKLIDEEGLYLDVVSGGELFTAYKSGFPMEKVLFHGNNKTIDEIEMGVNLGVGRFVVDNYYELELLQKICNEKSKIQSIYFRITPGIEAHTHDYIKTGQIDSKFGFALSNGDLQDALENIKKYENISLVGLHAHIGSQIFDVEPYLDEVEIMMNLVKEIKQQHNINIEEVDLGGGVGVYYTESDEPKTIKEFCSSIIQKVEDVCKDINISTPILIIEPGRSIVANAGSTIYTVGSIKDIKDVRTYVSVDGGMTDNIRPSLYQAGYECSIANKMGIDKNNKVTIAGKCCESGDILITDVDVMDIESGDILIMSSTGAYGYSMSSNYNKIIKPAVVSVKDGKSKLICKRESFEDLLRLEIAD
ncbi:diaminopimelate decarboxylase [[Clostridium] bifermentans ATCC 638]|uniref:Diaminopimelate decarboxylase n=1 Tax=Paraclostridium bifermentans ATCC 638 = DSM 14991 TaxID=1233171 RepID=T4VQW6_PARBF|nr:diaminopimelate decarboxylase [Paraclostridium bifermentans]EQK43087.1 diaminopimelate decarboxylase [[Clostridium] bifermentans ATCC 638] [Paraclostridium bifermentans ATCC 638 = DSM 14991]RIZ60315.1 diaminopimelate decarboxylase [Paraclostridium bifermentans]UAG16957.1 diaminopimelate decarboxylase [Paraclostridium bifermentans]